MNPISITTGKLGSIEEIKALSVNVHLERMTDGTIWLSVGEEHLWISAVKGNVLICRTEDLPKDKKSKKFA